MLRILRGELFISLMLAVAFMSLVEVFLGQGRVNSTVVSLALLFSSIGVFLAMIARAYAPTSRKLRRR